MPNPRETLAIEDALRPLLRDIHIAGMKGFIRPTVDGIHLHAWDNDGHELKIRESYMPYMADYCCKQYGMPTEDRSPDWYVRLAGNLIDDILRYTHMVFAKHGAMAKVYAKNVTRMRTNLPGDIGYYETKIILLVCDAISEAVLPQETHDTFQLIRLPLT